MSTHALFLLGQLGVLLAAFGAGWWWGWHARASVECEQRFTRHTPEPQRLRVIQGRTAALYDYERDGA